MTIYTTQQEPLKTKPVQGKVTVYNINTGEASTCSPIDARERLARGGWSVCPPIPQETIELDAGGLDEMADFIPDETIPPKRTKKKGQ